MKFPITTGKYYFDIFFDIDKNKIITNTFEILIVFSIHIQ